MAAVTQTFWGPGFGGTISASVTFDDVSGDISTITVANTDAARQIKVTLGTYQGADLWTRTGTANSGVVPYDVSGLGLKMTKNSKGFWVPPYTVAVQAG